MNILPKTAEEFKRAFNDEIMTPKQASEFIHVPERTLATWRTRRSGPVFIRVNGHKNGLVRYWKSDLVEFMSKDRLLKTSGGKADG